MDSCVLVRRSAGVKPPLHFITLPGCRCVRTWVTCARRGGAAAGRCPTCTCHDVLAITPHSWHDMLKSGLIAALCLLHMRACVRPLTKRRTTSGLCTNAWDPCMQRMTQPRLKPWTSRACGPATGTNSQARPVATSGRTAAPSPTCRRHPSCPPTSGSSLVIGPAPDAAVQHCRPHGLGMRRPAGGVWRHRCYRGPPRASCPLQHAQYRGYGHDGSQCRGAAWMLLTAVQGRVSCPVAWRACCGAERLKGPDASSAAPPVVRAIEPYRPLRCACALPGEATCGSEDTGCWAAWAAGLSRMRRSPALFSSFRASHSWPFCQGWGIH